MDLPTAPDDFLALSDRDLLAQCDLDTYRASGPGGRRHDTTDFAVRLRHRPTGLWVTATESRSQQVNRTRALRRLREAIALNVRRPLAPLAGRCEFVDGILAGRTSLRVNPKNPAYPFVVQVCLDALAQARGRVSEAAPLLRVTTAGFVRFLASEHKLWETANNLRRQNGLPPLHH